MGKCIYINNPYRSHLKHQQLADFKHHNSKRRREPAACAGAIAQECQLFISLWASRYFLIRSCEFFSLLYWPEISWRIPALISTSEAMAAS